MKLRPTVFLGEMVGYHYFKGDIRHFSETFIWDLDKTYLDTRIDSLSGLLHAFIERSWSKKNIPASNTLILRLQTRYLEEKGVQQFPIFFITASPHQMEERIREKLEYDGIRPIGCYFKNNAANLTPNRWGRLRRHIGYKLSALIYLRSQLGEHTQQTLWGDDSESDAVIYNLYSDICAQRVSDEELELILKKFSVAPETIAFILDQRKALPKNDPVRKIYINLAIDTDPDYYLKFGRRTIPTYNSFQIALDLFQDKKLLLDDVFTVYDEMHAHYGFTHEELVRSFLEFVKRGRLNEETQKIVLKSLIDKSIIKYVDLDSFRPPPFVDPWTVDQIDYLNEHRSY
ncbi:MAG: hypothetical protein NZ480_02290 [Bdellovibrionaceae bacterium]|nr:hypothetical protein [Pseudobdellovibrionaceae bacterium]MDW8190573.1 hypothetical protein [Pseudobdellovibrionaceae bacterium]